MENNYNYYEHNNQQNYYQSQNQDESYTSNNHNYSNYNKPKNKKKKFPKVLAVVGCALLFGVVASVTFMATNMIGEKLLGIDLNKEENVIEEETETKETIGLQTSYSVVASDVTEVVEEVMPSVVSITNLSIQEVQNFFGQTIQYESTGAGSGIIIAETDEELLIVTNYHVIADSETLTVTFYDDSNLEAYVKGTDSNADLAIVAVPLEDISDETQAAINIATLGDSTALKVGEPAIAIGNALGYGQSVTTGVISALNRSVTTENGTEDTGVKLIQTDAAINPGNSGGALLNANGEVIGINSSKLASTDVEGMGYAIPISDVSDILDDLMSQKTKRKVSEENRGYLGISGFDVTSEISQRYGIPVGVYVESVAEDGGAEAAGITKGNVITGLNGTAISDMETLQTELTYYTAGETVTVTIQIPENNGEYTEKNVELVLGEASK